MRGPYPATIGRPTKKKIRRSSDHRIFLNDGKKHTGMPNWSSQVYNFAMDISAYQGGATDF